jgi:hypothetical protein
MPKNNQLTEIVGYDLSRMRFSKPKPMTQPIPHETIEITTINEDGTDGDMLIRTPEDLFSFGLSPNCDKATGEFKGSYAFPISFYDQNSSKVAEPTDAQEAWVTAFDAMMRQCVKHIMGHLEEIGLAEDTPESQFRKFNPMFYTKVKDPVTGKSTQRVAEGAGPVLYSKVLYSQEKKTFGTIFCDKDNNELDPLDLIGKFFKTTSVLKLSSIFINGDRICPQIKLYETVVEEQTNEKKRFLGPAPTKRIIANPTVVVHKIEDDSRPPMSDEPDQEPEDVAPDDASDFGVDDDEPEPDPSPAKKVVRKVKTTKVRKPTVA